MLEKQSPEMTRLVCDCWRAMDFRPLAGVLSEDARFISQWNHDSYIGPENIMKYLNQKSKTLIKENSAAHVCMCRLRQPPPKVPVVAIGHGPGKGMLWYEDGSECFFVKQGEDKMIVMVEADEKDQIAQISLCMPQLFRFEFIDDPALMHYREMQIFGVEKILPIILKDGHLIKTTGDADLPLALVDEGKERLLIAFITECFPFKGTLDEIKQKILFEQAKKHKAKPAFASIGIYYAESDDQLEVAKPYRDGGFYMAYEGLQYLESRGRS